MTELICITCPKGCHVFYEDAEHITGFTCARGREYAIREMTHPTRVITSTVRARGGMHPRLPVKTDRDIPKELIMDAMRLLNHVDVQAPVKTGQVIVADICGTGANWVATRDY